MMRGDLSWPKSDSSKGSSRSRRNSKKSGGAWSLCPIRNSSFEAMTPTVPEVGILAVRAISSFNLCLFRTLGIDRCSLWCPQRIFCTGDGGPGSIEQQSARRLTRGGERERQHSLHVLGEQIELEVHHVTGLRHFQVRGTERVRNDPGSEALVIYLCNREADPINDDRSFFDDITHILRGQPDLKSPIAGLFVQGSDGRGAIDMPLHEMPSQSRAGRERSLQIDGAATLECSQIRAGNRFLEQIEG